MKVGVEYLAKQVFKGLAKVIFSDNFCGITVQDKR